MSNGISIHDIAESDYGAICNLYQDLIDLHVVGFPAIFSSAPIDIANDFEQWLSENRFIALVAKATDEVVGFAVGCMLQNKVKSHFIERKSMRIDDIVVRSDYRRLGIGKQLYQALTETGKAKGIDVVCLNVYSFNNGAREFYEAMGMHCVSMKYEIDFTELQSC